MEQTDNLGLPYIVAAQAQKHVTHNEAIRLLDVTVQLAVLSRSIATPPTSPVPGERYLVADAPTGEWQSHAQSIAAWQDGAWVFLVAQDGWTSWVVDEQTMYIYSQSLWAELITQPVLQNIDFVGINTTADANNRLAIGSAASLFSHEGSDHQLKINKNNSADTSSVVMQQNFQGKAEIGLVGDDMLSIKQSTDGVNWLTSAKFDATDGKASFPNNNFCENLLFNMLHDGGRFGGAPENPGTSVGAFSAPTNFTVYNGSAFSSGGKFTHNNSTFGGTAAALNADCEDLMNKIKVNQSAKRFGPEFYLMLVTAGTGLAAPNTFNSVTRHLLFTNRPSPILGKSSWCINVRAKTGSLAILPDITKSIMYVDGVEQTTPLELLPADGWKQIFITGFYNEETSPDYDSTLFKSYATVGATALFALPFIFPGTLQPRQGSYFGRVPSIQAWR